jgi:ligand-binding sensor domain-containing protein
MALVLREKRARLLPRVVILLFLLSLAACAPDTGVLGGGDWQAGGLQRQSIGALEVNPKDSQNLYAGDAQGNIFVSTDAGQHWVQQNNGIVLPNAIHALAFDIAGKKLYAATQAGLFVSTDGAQHWNTISRSTASLPADSYTALTFDADTLHTVYVGTTHHGVYVSTNDGGSWFSASTGLPQNTEIRSLALDSDHHQLWAATSLGIYRSDNQGTSWQAFNNGFPANITVNTVVPAAASGGAQGLIYAGTTRGVFRSVDDGEHWMTNSGSLSGTSIHFILVDFRSANATTAYAGTDLGAFRSDDNGQDWGGIASGLPRGEPVYALLIGANDYTQLYAAVDSDGVYLFPGTSGGLAPSRIFPFLLVVLFFFLLYQFTQRGRKRRRNTIEPERIAEAPSSER